MNFFACCGGIFFWIGVLWLLYVIIRMWRRNNFTSRTKVVFTLLLVMIPFALIGLLAAAMWLTENQTRTRPSDDALSGYYVTTDVRLPSATLIIRADGTYVLNGFVTLLPFSPPASSGTWSVEERDGHYEMGFGNWFGSPLHGQNPPYEIGLYVSDPDEGEVIFKRQGPVPSTQSQ